MRLFYVIFSFIVFSLTSNANELIELSLGDFGIDHAKKLILSNKSVVELNTLYPESKTSIQLDDLYTFQTSTQVLEIGVPYNVIQAQTNQVYILYFTELPIIYITTPSEIVDSPKVWASFRLTETNGNSISSDIGIEYRGAWSQTLPKKSMEIEFWEDQSGEETVDYSLLGMRTDDDWNLQAMFNEPLRFLSKTNNELWQMLHTVYYADLEPEAVNGIQMKYSELFINNEYKGIYAVSEKLDRKQLKLKNHNGNIRGELYKGDSWGATTFTSLPNYDNSTDYWGGWEYKHPDEEINWANLYNFTDFVINQSNSSFYATYQDKIDIDNFVDYFIFLNVLRATDNTGKNLYLARYNTNEPYFYVPWDLDGTFGIIWDGSQENITTGILTNGIYQRLWLDCYENGFREKLRDRWNEIKQTLFNHDFLMDKFSQAYLLLSENGVYHREEISWNGYVAEHNHLDYMSEWITNRLSFLDTTFNETCTMNIGNFEYPRIKIHPNPTSDIVYFDYDVSKKIEIAIYDIQGKLLQESAIENSNQSLSLSHLNSGIYFLKIKTDQGIQTEKIVITK